MKGIVADAVIGAESNVVAALVAEKYYNFDNDHKTDSKSIFITGSIGAGFGAGMKANEQYKISDTVFSRIKFFK